MAVFDGIGETVKIKTSHGHVAVVVASSLPAWQKAGWTLVNDNKPVTAEDTNQPDVESLSARLAEKPKAAVPDTSEKK